MRALSTLTAFGTLPYIVSPALALLYLRFVPAQISRTTHFAYRHLVPAARKTKLNPDLLASMKDGIVTYQSASLLISWSVLLSYAKRTCMSDVGF